MSKAIVLLSGGLDSATCLGIAKAEGFEVIALSFDYGQRHAAELDAARELAAYYGVRHLVVEAPFFRQNGGSALTSGIEVPKDRADEEMGEGIPVTYVPGRNLIFLAHAVAVAEVERAQVVFVGVNALDYSGYPDCRPEFVSAFQAASDLALESGTKGCGPIVRAPLVHLTKAKIVELGTRLAVPYELTHSCYDPVGDKACGRCDSCLLRRRGFEQAGVPDPTVYASPSSPDPHEAAQF